MLEENYASYRVKQDKPAQQPGGGYSEDALTTTINMMQLVHTTSSYWHKCFGQSHQKCKKVAFSQGSNSTHSDNAYQVFFMEDRVETDRKQSSVKAISKDLEPLNHHLDVAAFRPQQKPQAQNSQQFNNCGNQSRGQGFSRGNVNSRSSAQATNTSRKGKFCVYCKIMNHTQQECRKRIKNNKPCVNEKGEFYWPKINSTTDNNSAQNQNIDLNNGVGSVFL